MSNATLLPAHIPGRREAWLSLGVLFGLALVVRIVAAAGLVFPVPEDTAYYAGVARNLAEGRGLVTDALWSYQTPPLEVPRAAFEVWLPLPSLLAAIPVSLAGVENWFRASQVVSVVASAVAVALAWRLGADVAAELRLPVGRARTLAAGTGLVCSFLGPLVVYGMLPDSTALFAALALGSCLLMTRLAARPPESARDRRLLGLGLLIGLAALTRSEAVWLGLAWATMAWLWVRTHAPAGSAAPSAGSAALVRPGRRERLVLIAVPAAVAALVFAPWAVRDWLAFGTPLPGQTLANALSIEPTDIFAYRDQPTLARYLAEGPAALLGMRVSGTLHNLFAVLVLPGFPIGLIGLLALPKCWRLAALRPLLLTAGLTFLVTSLVFPVSTTWGTFLHAAGAVYVLLAVSCLVALDAFIAWVHRIRHWWRPVAWLGPALATAVAYPLLLVSVSTLTADAAEVRDRYDALPAALERAGAPLPDNAPVITDNPIWLAETARVTAIALPEESPESVLALADRFGATLLIVEDDGNRVWPAVLEAGGPAATCFREIELSAGPAQSPAEAAALAEIRAFRIGCP
jgi:hypothetical protein